MSAPIPPCSLPIPILLLSRAMLQSKQCPKWLSYFLLKRNTNTRTIVLTNTNAFLSAGTLRRGGAFARGAEGWGSTFMSGMCDWNPAINIPSESG